MSSREGGRGGYRRPANPAPVSGPGALSARTVLDVRRGSNPSLASYIDFDGCWTWTGYTRSDGYGQTKHAGRNVRTHRLIFELLVGSIPEGMELDHLCRNTRCCNPDHLEVVTPRENRQRGQRDRDPKRFCKRGHERVSANVMSWNGGCRTCRNIQQRETYRGST